MRLVRPGSTVGLEAARVAPGIEERQQRNVRQLQHEQDQAGHKEPQRQMAGADDHTVAGGGEDRRRVMMPASTCGVETVTAATQVLAAPTRAKVRVPAALPRRSRSKPSR